MAILAHFFVQKVGHRRSMGVLQFGPCISDSHQSQLWICLVVQWIL